MGLRPGDGTLVDERPYSDTLRRPRALLERGDRLSEPRREAVVHARLPVRVRLGLGLGIGIGLGLGLLLGVVHARLHEDPVGAITRRNNPNPNTYP